MMPLIKERRFPTADIYYKERRFPTAGIPMPHTALAKRRSMINPTLLFQ